MKKLCVVILFFVNTLFANIGSVTMVEGEVFVKRADKTQSLTLGSKIEKNDIIETKANSKVKITFIDNTIITIGKESSLDIKEYNFLANDPASAKTELSVTKGAFHAITGQIGKVNPNKFKIKTKNATIGIRGTEIYGNQSKIICTHGMIFVESLLGDVKNIANGNFVHTIKGKPLSDVIKTDVSDLDGIKESFNIAKKNASLANNIKSDTQTAKKANQVTPIESSQSLASDQNDINKMLASVDSLDNWGYWDSNAKKQEVAEIIAEAEEERLKREQEALQEQLKKEQEERLRQEQELKKRQKEEEDRLRAEQAQKQQELMEKQQREREQEVARQEAARQEAARLEAARLEAERAKQAAEDEARRKQEEAARLERERQEAIRQQQAAEQARLERERQEAQEAARKKQEEAARLEQERLEAARKKAEQEAELARQQQMQQEAEAKRREQEEALRREQEAKLEALRIEKERELAELKKRQEEQAKKDASKIMQSFKQYDTHGLISSIKRSQKPIELTFSGKFTSVDLLDGSRLRTFTNPSENSINFKFILGARTNNSFTGDYKYVADYNGRIYRYGGNFGGMANYGDKKNLFGFRDNMTDRAGGQAIITGQGVLAGTQTPRKSELTHVMGGSRDRTGLDIQSVYIYDENGQNKASANFKADITGGKYKE